MDAFVKINLTHSCFLPDFCCYSYSTRRFFNNVVGRLVRHRSDRISFYCHPLSGKETSMKDSYNYSGFSNTFLVSRKGKKSARKGPVIIESDERARLENDPSRFYPPYLTQPTVVKPQFKK